MVPPTKTASLSRRGARSGARDRTIRRVKALGRRRWKKASGDHQHARVEHAFFRYTSIVGDCLRARRSSGPRREAVLACHVLNRMTELGRPVSYRIGRGRARRCEARRSARIRAPTPRTGVGSGRSRPAGASSSARASPTAHPFRQGAAGGWSTTTCRAASGAPAAAITRLKSVWPNIIPRSDRMDDYMQAFGYGRAACAPSKLEG